jgi:1-acyl-sn-glycerol-3-phosphate acyltransferase
MHSAMSSVSVGCRIAKFLRLVAHFSRGLLTLAFRFDAYTAVERTAAIRRWSRQLLKIVGVRVRHTGHVPAAGLIVMNHISWLDVVVLNALAPSRFVSKSEVAAWPLVGYLCTKSGTLYIERTRKTAARRTNHLIAAALASGERVAVFPEGTTTAGDKVLHFHAALLQPIIATAGRAYPAILRYLDEAGARSTAVSYVGDETLVGSVWRLLSARRVVARIEFANAEEAAGRHRRELASALHTSISRGLAPDSQRTAPGRDGGLQVEPR